MGRGTEKFFWPLSELFNLQAGRSPVRFPIGSLRFLIDVILPAALWPCYRLSLYKNEYQWYLLEEGGKDGWWVGLTTLPLASANCVEILGVWTSWSPQDFSRDGFTIAFYLPTWYAHTSWTAWPSTWGPMLSGNVGNCTPVHTPQHPTNMNLSSTTLPHRDTLTYSLHEAQSLRSWELLNTANFVDTKCSLPRSQQSSPRTESTPSHPKCISHKLAQTG